MKIEKQYHFVAISGSLRKGSYNTMTLKTMQKLAPEIIHIEELPIVDLPFYNADLHEHIFPEAVEKLNDAIYTADALILVTPEYNYSVPAVLKNALDFISRSPKKPLDKKPVGIIGASQGMFGTARAQYHLRQILVYFNAFVMNKPEVMIAQANNKFDWEGNLIDEKTKEQISNFIKSLADYCDFLKQK